MCVAVSTNAAMTQWERRGRIMDNPTCSGCSSACPHCTAPGCTCNATAPRPGCVPPIPDMIPRFGFRDPTTPYLAPCEGAANSTQAPQAPQALQAPQAPQAPLCWFVVVGSGTTKGRESAGLLYRSRSAEDITSAWTFVSVLLQEAAGAAFEQYQYSCPGT